MGIEYPDADVVHPMYVLARRESGHALPDMSKVDFVTAYANDPEGILRLIEKYRPDFLKTLRPAA